MPLTIHFVPDNRIYEGEEEVSLALAAAFCDIIIDQPCGSRATCGKCRVLIHQGAPLPTEAERRLLSPDELRRGWRLACQVIFDQNAVVEVPQLTRALRAKGFGLPALVLPSLIRNREILSAQERGMRGDSYGLAYDLGSTSVAGALIDLKTGNVLAEDSELNPQVAYGADIISRIHFAQMHEDGIKELQRALLTAIRSILGQLSERTGVSPEHIDSAMMVGNPTMIHSLLGVDVSSLGRAPYVGVWTQAMTIRAEELGLPLQQNAKIHLLPMIHSHVGSDTVAAILATGIDTSPRWKLLIDLGTNSEVVLGSQERIVVTSAAAGPAFEGTTISHGMRATAGAIEGVYMGRTGRINIKTIGNEPPKGICGTGLIDAVAELLQVGLITSAGYLKSPEELGHALFPHLREAILTQNDERAVVLVDAKKGACGRSVLLTASDIRQLQLAKGSIRAGITILSEYCGVSMDDLDQVLLAGAFGSHLRKASLLAIGLIPEVNPEVIHFVGNAAGAGCRLALVDEQARERADQIHERAEYIELAGHPRYQELFSQAIGFPRPEESI